MPPVPGVGTVIARGGQSAETMQQAGQQGAAAQPSAFDVWTHSYDGMAARMDAAASDPVGFLANDPAQQARVAAAQLPGQWSHSSIDQAANSIAAQAGNLGNQVQAIGEAQGALQTVGATFALLTGVEQMISSVLSVIPFPAFPAVRITDMDVGLPHGHSHPPNLVPPAPLIPLPSTGPVIPIPILSGATQTLINGMPAARCGDMGLGIWCGGYFPMYEIFLGSSSVWIEGARAARVALDITKHCMFTTPKPQDLPLGPMIGMTISSSSNVLIGGVPMPSLTALGIGAAFKGLASLLGKGARAFGRLTAPLRRKIGEHLDDGFLKCSILRAEPVNSITGEVTVDQQDYSIPGPIPLEWNRHYGSRSTRRGVCGYGWCAPADGRLELEPDGTVLFFDSKGIAKIFPPMGNSESVEEFVDGAQLKRIPEGFLVELKTGISHLFRQADVQGNEILVSRVFDRCGNYVNYERDKDGLRAIVERSGRYIEVKSEGNLVREMVLRHPRSDDSRLLARYEYNAVGELVAVYDALGEPYTFRYDHSRLVQHIDRNGLSFYYGYDGDAQTARCHHAWGDGGLYDYRFDFDPVARRVTIRNSLDAVSTLQLNELNLPVWELDPLGGMTQYEYDDRGRTTSVIDPGGHHTSYEYDSRGNLLKLTRPDGKSIQTEFDAADKAVKITDPNGAVWQQEWDERGLLTRQISPLGSESRYEYDAYGQLVRFANPRGARTALGFDDFGNLTQLSDALGCVTTFGYDILGNVTAKTDALSNRTSYDYDLKGRLHKVTLPSGASVTCGYDHDDNLTRYVDEKGAETRLEYFGLGEIKRRVQPDGYSVEYHYDTEERLIGVTNQRGETYRLNRDVLGRIVEEVDYWGQARQYTYDASGYIASSTDPLGRSIQYVCDPLGRILKKTLPDGFVEEFGYDANGNLTEAQNPHGAIKRNFNAEGRLTEETQGAFTIKNTYDANGNRVARQTSLGNTVAFEFDVLDQVVSVCIDQEERIVIERDSVGRIVHESLGSRLSRSFSYSADGYLTEQSFSANQSPIFATTFSYDVAGNLTQRNDSQHGADIYRYDPLGRITEHLNPRGRITAYLNDQAGDRIKTRIVESGQQLIVGGDVVEGEWSREGECDGTYYRFDRAGNLVERQDSERDLSLVWNANQRLVESHANGTVTCYGYDPLGRRLFKETGNRRTLFYWDGDALVAERVVALNKQQNPMRVSDHNVVASINIRGANETVVASNVREYLYYPNTLEPLALIEWEGRRQFIYDYHNDPNGCPIRLTDGNGVVKWAARYSGWGQTFSLHIKAVDNPLRFQGQYEDQETGFFFNRYRYFEPKVGQFISQDPVRLDAGEDLYWYSPNPWSWIDPLGLSCRSLREAKRVAGIPRGANPVLQGRDRFGQRWWEFEVPAPGGGTERRVIAQHLPDAEHPFTHYHPGIPKPHSTHRNPPRWWSDPVKYYPLD